MGWTQLNSYDQTSWHLKQWVERLLGRAVTQHQKIEPLVRDSMKTLLSSLWKSVKNNLEVSTQNSLHNLNLESFVDIFVENIKIWQKNIGDRSIRRFNYCSDVNRDELYENIGKMKR